MCTVATRAGTDVVARIHVDRPLKDPSICLGPGGIYYLTGTVAVLDEADGGPDFYNNYGVFMWKSDDLKKWEPLGCVFDLRKHRLPKWSHHGEQAVRYASARWLHKQQVRDDEPNRVPVMGVSAPEVHYFRDTFWIALSNHCGTTLLKSTSGNAEGPYEQHALCTLYDRDASIFFDPAEQGKAWWVFACGRIAPMKDDLTGIAGRPVLMQPKPKDASGCPLKVGEHGAFLFKHNGRYHLLCSEFTEDNRFDVFVADADAPDGPYGKRRLLIPGGGQSAVFRDKNGSLMAACHDRDGAPVIVSIGME
jgi:beta-xylosidase